MGHQKDLVDSGRWLLYRYDPRHEGNPLQLDMRSPKAPVSQTLYNENRFKMLATSQPAAAKILLQEAQEDVNARWQMYEYLAARHEEKDS
jgi:pyruvate-ferredoxin/flavodoxin oxidoreductase